MCPVAPSPVTFCALQKCDPGVTLLSIFTFVVCASGVISKKSCLDQCPKMFSSKGSIELGLKFQAVGMCELTFGEGRGSSLIF